MHDRIWVAERSWLAQHGDRYPELVDEPVPGLAVAAEVNHGRWIVHCPFCPGAQMACERDPRFFCADCRNTAAGHRWVMVAFPDQAAEIEAELVKRPHAANRNWQPGETVGELQAELALRELVPTLERVDVDPAALSGLGRLILGGA